MTIQDAPFGGGPVPSRPAQRPRTTRRQLRATPRQATTPGPTLTPRSDPRAELRHPCAPLTPNHARWPKWLRLPAHNWLCILARSHFTELLPDTAVKRSKNDSNKEVING